jgi:hypothetical protein
MIIDVIDTASRYLISVFHRYNYNIFLAGSQAILAKKGGYAIPLTVKTVSPLA